MRRRYARPLRKILRKIRRRIPLSYSEIALYFGIERRIVKNIFFMYRNYGRDSVESITLSDKQIDKIISLKYPKGMIQ
ncbi:hypothetical protein [Anaeromicrobium sediminis]|uniref:Uncharacterized protein n=1 Tax=Anaeromicrobium sediminis TaxID=1478221 RepID=A0A267MQY1_9FIRM|nr:hypothetical protein [Anaeromicrobium sediminis]PAB61335.1 hypothetical protein CCE28_02575 [Anaeromicrobium sediminis]